MPGSSIPAVNSWLLVARANMTATLILVTSSQYREIKVWRGESQLHMQLATLTVNIGRASYTNIYNIAIISKLTKKLSHVAP